MNTQPGLTTSASEYGCVDMGTLRTDRSLKRRIVRLLDRPGGRFLLGAIATRVARSSSQEDVAIKYLSGLWTRRRGSCFLPDGPRFDYFNPDLTGVGRELERRDADAREYWLRYYTPKEGDVVFDVGAGRGEDVLTFSRGVGKTGRVIAIEADPISFASLENFCRLNRLANTVALHVAAMEAPGRVRIQQSASSWTENSVRVDQSGTGLAVPADTIDAICGRRNIGDIAFLKMNIEGAERYALQGMKRIIPNVRHICVACHDFRAEMGHGEEYRTRVFVEGFLRQSGFELESRGEDPRDYVRDHVFGLRRVAL